MYYYMILTREGTSITWPLSWIISTLHNGCKQTFTKSQLNIYLFSSHTVTQTELIKKDNKTFQNLYTKFFYLMQSMYCFELPKFLVVKPAFSSVKANGCVTLEEQTYRHWSTQYSDCVFLNKYLFRMFSSWSQYSVYQCSL